MKVENLIAYLQHDLKNERKHLAFYLHSASMVQGPHREEYREFFLEEARSELQHVQEFADLIVYLGGTPEVEVGFFPTTLRHDDDILSYIVDMEQEVADNYALRLRQTHEMEDAATACAHVFYEDQIKDSQKAAWEVQQWRNKTKSIHKK